MLIRLHSLRTRSAILVALGAAALVLVTACSPAPMPISQSRKDPSSPLAPEGATPPRPREAVPVASAPEHAHEHHGHSHAEHSTADHGAVGGGADGGASSIVYVCPMHPEVTANAPDALCPKCNMKLVPKK